MCGPAEWPEHNMQIETKYLRLRTSVTLDSRFGDWRVCWLGGWEKHRMYFLVMLVRLGTKKLKKEMPPCAIGTAAVK